MAGTRPLQQTDGACFQFFMAPVPLRFGVVALALAVLATGSCSAPSQAQGMGPGSAGTKAAAPASNSSAAVEQRARLAARVRDLAWRVVEQGVPVVIRCRPRELPRRISQRSTARPGTRSAVASPARTLQNSLERRL